MEPQKPCTPAKSYASREPSPALLLVGLMWLSAWVGVGAAVGTMLVPGWDFFLSALLIPLVIVPLSTLGRYPLTSILCATSVGEALLGLLARRPVLLESQRLDELEHWQATLVYMGLGVGIGFVLGLLAGILLRDLSAEPTSWDLPGETQDRTSWSSNERHDFQGEA